jgi:hypothetical protein
MRKQDVLDHFGGVTATAETFKVTKQAVSRWRDVVPKGIAYEAQVITAGRLVVDPSMYQRRSNRGKGPMPKKTKTTRERRAFA